MKHANLFESADYHLQCAADMRNKEPARAASHLESAKVYALLAIGRALSALADNAHNQGMAKPPI